jgi:redox-sensitive bicupin YhaK (pirin superfamily)
VHSERAPADLKGTAYQNHGLQLWLAVPTEREEDVPGFQHVPSTDIPSRVADGVELRVLIGSAFGLTSPVRAVSPTLYVNLNFPAAKSAAVTIPDAAEERALYSADEGFELDGQSVPAHTMVVLDAGSEPVLRASRGAHIVLIGGTPLGHRFMVWNFVSSHKERIIAAQDDWEAQRFERVPGETEFIPLPVRA